MDYSKYNTKETYEEYLIKRTIEKRNACNKAKELLKKYTTMFVKEDDCLTKIYKEEVIRATHDFVEMLEVLRDLELSEKYYKALVDEKE